MANTLDCSVFARRSRRLFGTRRLIEILRAACRRGNFDGSLVRNTVRIYSTDVINDYGSNVEEFAGLGSVYRV